MINDCICPFCNKELKDVGERLECTCSAKYVNALKLSGRWGGFIEFFIDTLYVNIYPMRNAQVFIYSYDEEKSFGDRFIFINSLPTFSNITDLVNKIDKIKVLL